MGDSVISVRNRIEAGRDERRATRRSNERTKRFFDRYEWWFVVLGLIGNGLFFLGSVCFFFKSLETLAISLFVAGSCFMLVSSTAGTLSEYSSNQLE
jgi:hypothetical protein